MNSTFYEDTKHGLQQQQKSLASKYFYNPEGDRLFQQIMALEEYYPSRCEAEILREQAGSIVRPQGPFDLIELGAGDGTKTVHLLRHLSPDSYIPVDISGHILGELQCALKAQLPDLDVTPVQGEYLPALQKAVRLSSRHKVVLFLGANIGNFTPFEAAAFCTAVRRLLAPGDTFIVGFDLKKDPRIIQQAYDDSLGVTRLFNLNLLKRINNELGADFAIRQFEHYCSYDPITGACKSYLVSLCDQLVSFPDYQVRLERGECVWTEISQKYSRHEITQMMTHAGYKVENILTDRKDWFALMVGSVLHP